MRVVRALVAVSAVAASMLSTMGLAGAQAPAAKPATAKPTVAKPATTTASAASTEEGNPVALSPLSTTSPSKAGLELKAIHQADTKWRGGLRRGPTPRVRR